MQMKYSNGFTRWQESSLSLIAFALSIACAAIAFKRMDMGVAYALWSGLGTLAAVAIGIICFDEPSTLMKMAFVGMIAVGLVGLNMVS